MQSPPANERRFLSTGAAARLAGCATTTVWRAIERGELAATRLGRSGHYRIERDELEAWLKPTTQEEART